MRLVPNGGGSLPGELGLLLVDGAERGLVGSDFCFELVTVPYLLRPSQEEKIYERDVAALSKNKKCAPHAVELLCTWAVMTRYKQPDPEYYDSAQRGLIARLDPRSKVRLYEDEPLRPLFKQAEETQLRELRTRIMSESVGMVVYEGRFGARSDPPRLCSTFNAGILSEQASTSRSLAGPWQCRW